MATRRTWFAWHSWIGLTAGLLMFVICWSGTMAVFSREIDMLLDERIQAQAAGETVAWQAVYESIREARPSWTINQLNGPLSPGFAAEAWMEDEDGVMRRIYADPATGEITGVTSYLNVQRFFRSLHMALFIYDFPIFGIPFGFFLVGVFSLVLLASLVTSLLFYSRFWRGFFKLQTHKGPKVFWSDLHKLTGLWGLWFVLVIGVTGLWYLAEWKAPESTVPPEPPGAVAGAPPLSLDLLVANAKRAYPELRVHVVSPWQLEEGLLEVQGQDGSWLVRNRGARVWVNSYTGQVLGVKRPSELSAYERWIDTADPLHFGDFAGLWSKTLWFLFGLALSGLSLTGAYLQAKRQRRHHQTHYRPPILIAYAATLAVLLATAFYGYKEALTFGAGGTQLPAIGSAQLAFIAIWSLSTVAVLTLWAWKVR